MSYRRCDKCRSWRNCRGYSWYQPFEIENNYCKVQFIYLIDILDTLGAGIYPPDPAYSGYTELIGKPIFGPKKHTANDIHAEVTARIDRTEDDGKTLVHEVKVLGAQLFNLSGAARNALNYCVGEKRKKLDYGIWLSQRRWRSKIIVKEK